MKKLICLLAIAALANVAQASTTEVIPDQECTYYAPTTGTCTNPEVSLQFNALASYLSVEGVNYTGPAFPASHVYSATPFYADDGTLVLFTGTLVYHAKTINAGRAHYTRHWWTLEGASVTWP